jgi:2-keto-3-deoxy-L-rhamnonate aldolase RhmA
MGHLGDTRDPEVVQTIEAAGESIRATGRAAGFQFFDERAAQLFRQGFTLGAVAGDLHTVSVGMAQRLTELR